MPNQRTLVILTLLLNIASNLADNDLQRPPKYEMPISKEPLLRSSEDKQTSQDALYTLIKDNLSKQKISQEIFENLSIDLEKAADTTTSMIDVTTENAEYIDMYGEKKEIKKEVDKSTAANEDVTTVDVMSLLDSTTDAKVTDVTKTKIEATPMTLTTSHDLTLTAKSSEKEIEPVQRSPKTENSEPDLEDHKTHTKSIPESHQSKSTVLREWLEDPWLRQPPAILVPLRPVALIRALAVWNDLTSEKPLNLTDIVVIGYDSHGINWRSRHNLVSHSRGKEKMAVKEVLSKLIKKYQDVRPEPSSDQTMRALTLGSKLVPYDSALFIITDEGPSDSDKLPLALKALVEKRLRVYTIWTEPMDTSKESDASLQLLRNISEHTEGNILPYALQIVDFDNILDLDINQLDLLGLPQARMAKLNSVLKNKLQTLLVKRGGGGSSSVGFPVESGATGLRIVIEGEVDSAVLYPPNDAPLIDLYNLTSVTSYSSGSRNDALEPRDVFLSLSDMDPNHKVLNIVTGMTTPKPPQRATVGLWHLNLRCDNCDYRLTISAYARIRLETELVNDAKLKLVMIGPISSIRESLLVDEYGTELEKLSFSHQPQVGDIPEDPLLKELDKELKAEVPLPKVKGSRVYAKIVGRDVKGEAFVRLSGPLNLMPETRMGRSAKITFPDTPNDLEQAEEYNEREFNRLLFNNTVPVGNGGSSRSTAQVINQLGTIMTSVQIGFSTKLYGAPGDAVQLHYEVTNHRDRAVSFSFRAIGELRFLRGISSRSQTIAAGQTALIIVYAVITRNAQPGARDLITFTATGIDEVSVSSYIYVVASNNQVTDVWPPELRHTFQGSCLGKQGDDCAQHTWSTTVIARDNLGGLLRLSSSPIGLLYDNNFVSGTREEVTATYRATCCTPRVLVTAGDIYGNANSYFVDISNYFTPASISAIVLGIFLFIALIFIIILMIYWCVKRRKESRELPYTTSSRREIN